MTKNNPKPENDEALFLRYQSGDSAAFAELYHRWSPRIYGFLVNRVARADLRDDLLQMIWAKIHTSRSTFNRNEKFAPWVFAIARHSLIDAHRMAKARPEGHIAIDDVHDVLETDAHAVSATQETQDVSLDQIDFSMLTESQCELIRLRFTENLSFDEISKQTGVQAATLRQQMRRALQKLKEKLS